MAAKKVVDLERLALTEGLNLAEPGFAVSLASLSKLTNLQFNITQSRGKVPGMAGMRLAPNLRSLTLDVGQPFPFSTLTQLSALEELTLISHQADTTAKWHLQPLSSLERLWKLMITQVGSKGFPILGFGGLTQLEELTLLTTCTEPELPPGLACLTRLRELTLASNSLLDSVLGALTQLEGLTVMREYNWKGLVAPPLPSLAAVASLRQLELCNGGKFPSLPCSLQSLTLRQCASLADQAVDLGQLAPQLESLSLELSSMASLHLGESRALRELSVACVPYLARIDGFEHATALERLSLHTCREHVALPGLEHATKLHTLQLVTCPDLAALPDLSGLTRLTMLVLDDLLRLPALPGVASLPRLELLSMRDCGIDPLGNGLRMHDVAGIETLPALRALWLSSVLHDLLPESIPQLTRLKSLELEALPGGRLELGWVSQLVGLTSLDLIPGLVLPIGLQPPCLRALTALKHAGFDDSFELMSCARQLPVSVRSFSWEQEGDADSGLVRKCVDVVRTARQLTQFRALFPADPHCYFAWQIDFERNLLAALNALRGKAWGQRRVSRREHSGQDERYEGLGLKDYIVQYRQKMGMVCFREGIV